MNKNERALLDKALDKAGISFEGYESMRKLEREPGIYPLDTTPLPPFILLDVDNNEWISLDVDGEVIGIYDFDVAVTMCKYLRDVRGLNAIVLNYVEDICFPLSNDQ